MWMVNEYAKAMALYHQALKTFFEAYTIAAVEVLDDISKFKWSNIAKGAVSANQRQIELLEAELRASGKECAYVFDARKRFGRK
jgi:hypothetical protein